MYNDKVHYVKNTGINEGSYIQSNICIVIVTAEYFCAAGFSLGNVFFFFFFFNVWARILTWEEMFPCLRSAVSHVLSVSIIYWPEIDFDSAVCGDKAVVSLKSWLEEEGGIKCPWWLSSHVTWRSRETRQGGRCRIGEEGKEEEEREFGMCENEH